MKKNSEFINLTTGPVKIPESVSTLFCKAPVSHRGDAFIEAFQQLRKRICASVNAQHVQLCSGSGTLANEIMLHQLKRLNGKGIVLSNGEFGNRIIHQCQRNGLSFLTYEKHWGEEFDLTELETRIASDKEISWLLFVYSESSTGCINNLDQLRIIARKYHLKVAVDAMSAIGNQPFDMRDIYLATASSGKGLCSFAGIAIVFSNDAPDPDNSIPAYVDLGYYFLKDGMPFTISSNLIFALQEAIEYTLHETHLQSIYSLSGKLYDTLSKISLIQLLNANYTKRSHIITLIPQEITARELGDRLMARGIETSYNSKYLIERNYLQIAIMGDHSEEEIRTVATTIACCCHKHIQEPQASL